MRQCGSGLRSDNIHCTQATFATTTQTSPCLPLLCGDALCADLHQPEAHVSFISFCSEYVHNMKLYDGKHTLLDDGHVLDIDVCVYRHIVGR